MNKLKKDLTVAEILLTLDEGTDKLAIANLIEEQQANKLTQYGNDQYELGRKEGIRWSNLRQNVIELLCWVLGSVVTLGLLFAIYWGFHVYNAKQEQLEIQESAACSAGQFAPCIYGWSRVGTGSMQARVYEESYYNSTGKFLIVDPNDRLMSLMKRDK